jgi:peptide/nickel transport system substrate-binding protein
LEFSAWLDQFQKGRYDLSFAAWAGSPDPDNVSYTTFDSTGVRNLNGYKNPTVDDLLEKARRVRAPSVRKQFYAQFQQLLADDAPYCFLYHQQRWYAYGSEYRGFQ